VNEPLKRKDAGASVTLMAASTSKSLPPFDSISNFRDVGKSINTFLDSPILKEGLLFRSARPDEATIRDRRILQNDLCIKTIIDLRSATEHEEQARKHQRRIVAEEDCEKLLPLQLKGINNVSINFNGSSFQRLLVRRLSWISFFHMVILLLLGHRLSAIGILGRKVMQPKGLGGLAQDSIEVCGSEIKAVFDILAKAESYPVLVHCTQGKDRTGLVVQLTLMLLGVPRQAIDFDYMMTAIELLPEREERVKEVATIGLDDEFVDCDAKLVERVEKHINKKYGSMERYLAGIGVSEEQQNAIRKMLSPSRFR
jgi:protein-tyrosine phosphatase